MAGRLTRKVLSGWIGNVQGEIGPPPWEGGKEMVEEKELYQGTEQGRGVSVRIQVFQMQSGVSLADTGWQEHTLSGVHGFCCGSSLLPKVVWTNQLGIMLGFQQRRDHVTDNLPV